MTQEEKYEIVKNLAIQLREDLLKLEFEFNQKMKDFKNKWQKDFYKVDINPINLIHPGYDQNRRGIVQLLGGITYKNEY